MYFLANFVTLEKSWATNRAQIVPLLLLQLISVSQPSWFHFYQLTVFAPAIFTVTQAYSLTFSPRTKSLLKILSIACSKETKWGFYCWLICSGKKHDVQSHIQMPFTFLYEFSFGLFLTNKPLDLKAARRVQCGFVSPKEIQLFSEPWLACNICLWTYRGLRATSRDTVTTVFFGGWGAPANVQIWTKVCGCVTLEVQPAKEIHTAIVVRMLFKDMLMKRTSSNSGHPLRDIKR